MDGAMTANEALSPADPARSSRRQGSPPARAGVRALAADVATTGQLLSYGDSGTPGNVSDPVTVGLGGWQDFLFLFAGQNAAGENRIYAVNPQGELLSYGDSGTTGNVSDPVIVGLAGWQDVLVLFAGANVAGENRIYAVTPQGELRSYGDSGTAGNVSDPVIVGLAGWQDFLFLAAGPNAAGENRIYAVNPQGELPSYGDSGVPGNVSDPVIVASGGWQDVLSMFTGRNDLGENQVYAVNPQGELLSYGDDGTPGNVSEPVIVGLGGWQEFEFLFAGANGAGANRIYAAVGVRVMTTFTPGQHGWHFDNTFVNHLIGGLITTYGLCGGMAYSSLDYYFSGIPIPTHRTGDFGNATATCPPDGRLHTMIFNRLIDTYGDNFGKWSCIYPDLDAAVGAALGLIIDGGLLGVILGGIDGWIYGELHEIFACPGGGPAGMTAHELPHLLADFLDKGLPAPIGLIYDSDITHIGESHQIVAYGYAVVGGKTRVYIYDNRMHDRECILTIDPENPGEIVQTLANGAPLPDGNNGNWKGLLVSDGYQSQVPSYGQDIGIATPPVLTLSSQQGGFELTDSFSVQNYGEFQAHYQSLGVEIGAPEGTASFDSATAPQSDNLLAPGDTVAARISVNGWGSVLGTFVFSAGYDSVPLNAETSLWLKFLYPPTSQTVEPGGTTPVPELNGLTPEEAITVLTRVGLTGEVGREQTAAVDIPQVFAQDPAPATIVPPSTLVTLSVWIPKGGTPP
jgi:hypothetical protein